MLDDGKSNFCIDQKELHHRKAQLALILLRAVSDIENHAQTKFNSASFNYLPPNPNNFSWIIPYSPAESMTDKIMHSVSKHFKQLEPGYNIRTKGFSSSREIIEHIKDPGIQLRFLCVCNFVGNFSEYLPGNVYYLLRFPFYLRKSQTPESTWLTHKLLDTTVFPSNMNENPSRYYLEGFSAVQYAIDKAILQIKGVEVSANDRNQLFPEPAYKIDNIVRIAPEYFPVIFLVIFSFYNLWLTRSIVEEKESGIREMIHINGVSNEAILIAWFIEFFSQLVVMAVLITLLLTLPYTSKGAVINNSNPVLVFLFLLLYSSSTVSFQILISTFFKKSQPAAMISGVAWFLSIGPFIVLDTAPYNSKAIALFLCGLHNVAMGEATSMLAEAEAFTTGIQFGNIWEANFETDPLSFGNTLICLLVDTFLYFLLALYIETLTFTKDYNFIKYVKLPYKYIVSIQKKNQSPLLQASVEYGTNNENFAVNMMNVCKIYGRNSPTVLKDITMDVRRNEITVLLGHNGAGKTTLISILTGTTSLTSGEVLVYNRNIGTHMKIVRKSLGFCSQNNTLYDNFTIEEHFLFYGRLRKLPTKYIIKEMEYFLQSLHLMRKRHSRIGSLSGGMKRQVNLSLAFLGSPQLVILDEPTTGMDPATRRLCWNLLLKAKERCSIIISTHYMDEAEIIGDRIGILANGKLGCFNTPLNLKNEYSTGYNLTVVRNDNSTFPQIRDTIVKYLPEDVYLPNEKYHGKELIFKLPAEIRSNLDSLLQELEINQEKLGIMCFGVGLTSIEDVFVTVTDSFGITFTDLTQSEIEEVEQTSISLVKITLYQIWAIIYKKLIASRCNWAVTASQIFIPLVYSLIAIGVYQAIRENLKQAPPLHISLSEYNSIDIAYKYNFSNNKVDPLVESFISIADGSQRRKLYNVTEDSMDDFLLDVAIGNWKEYATRLMIAFEKTEYCIKQYYNNIAYHSLPLIQNLVTNARILSSGKHNDSVHVWNYPLPRNLTVSSQKLLLSDIFGELILAIQMCLGFGFITASFAMFTVYERIVGAKHLQFTSGLPPILYWFVTLIYDLFIFGLATSSAGLLIALVKVSGEQLSEGISAIMLLFLTYGFASIPFVYNMSALFQNPGEAFGKIILVNIILGILPAILIYYVDTLESSTVSAISYFIFFAIMPSFSLTVGIIDLNTNLDSHHDCQIQQLNPMQCLERHGTELYSEEYYDWRRPGCMRYLVAMVVYGALSITLLIFLDYGAPLLRKIRSYFYKETTNENHEDVLEVDNLYKTFKSKDNLIHAVNDVTFNVGKGECFGLIGVNGAGKTTTFKIILGQISFKKGQIYINGKNIKTNSTLKDIGYCPQFDAHLEHMTCEQLLKFYAMIKSVIYKNETFANIAENLASDFSIERHLHKKVKRCSLGTKRKLSVAIALLGNPKILFLDEPSSGMDPLSRIELWNTLSKFRRKGTSMLLTSHCMQECETLCTKVAFMNKGQLLSCGSVQEIRQKWGHTYTLIAQTMNTNEFLDFRARHFPSSEVRIEKDNVVVKISRKTVKLWEVFSIIENHKVDLGILNYAVCEITLEESFLSFLNAHCDLNKM